MRLWDKSKITTIFSCKFKTSGQRIPKVFPQKFITNIIKKCKERNQSYTFPRIHLNAGYLSFAMQTTVRHRMYGMSAYLHICKSVLIRNVPITSHLNYGTLHINGQYFQRTKEAFPNIH